MTNPFPTPITPTWLIHNRLTPHQRDYAAHAINQHEKQKEVIETYRAMHQVDGIGGQTWDCVTYTRLLDKLNKLEAALLKEEKP